MLWGAGPFGVVGRSDAYPREMIRRFWGAAVIPALNSGLRRFWPVFSRNSDHDHLRSFTSES